MFDAALGVPAIIERNLKKHALVLRIIGNRIALSPPVIITEGEVDELVAHLECALDDTAEELQAGCVDFHRLDPPWVRRSTVRVRSPHPSLSPRSGGGLRRGRRGAAEPFRSRLLRPQNARSAGGSPGVPATTPRRFGCSYCTTGLGLTFGKVKIAGRDLERVLRSA